MLTDEQLARIRARADAATPGPWSHTLLDDGVWAIDRHHAPGNVPADAAFMAGARADIPALLAEVARLRAEARRMTALHARTVEELDAARAEGERLHAALADVVDAYDHGRGRATPVPDHPAITRARALLATAYDTSGMLSEAEIVPAALDAAQVADRFRRQGTDAPQDAQATDEGGTDE